MERDIREGLISEEAVRECLEGARCPESCSYIRAENTEFIPGTLALAIDCGGTKTRCIIHESCRDGSERITAVAEGPNESFEGAGRGLDGFASAVCSAARSHLNGRAIDGIAVIWSNDINCEPRPWGVTGIVTNKESGISYRKGEPYTRILRDGDDIGEVFRHAAGGESAVAVLNDTIAVALAVEGAAGGVVLSTGGNATCARDGYFQNMEAGAKVRLPVSCLTDAERSRFGDTLTLEQACAGKWLPELYLVNNPGFSAPAGFSGKIFSSLVPASLDGATADERIAFHMADRAAKLCAVLGAISLRPFLASSKEERLIVNLDSRIAEGISWFSGAANEMLARLIGGGRSASFRLIGGSDGLAVLRGAVRALHRSRRA